MTFENPLKSATAFFPAPSWAAWFSMLTVDMNANNMHHSPASEKNEVGISVPNGAATGRYAMQRGFFVACARPVLGSRAGGPQGRRCSIGTLTLVRSALPISVGKAVQNRNWSKTMENTEAHAVDRKVASAINPLIGSCWTEDTLDAVASVVYEIGFMVSETELSKENTFRVFEAAAAALWWERENIKSCNASRKEKDSGHV